MSKVKKPSKYEQTDELKRDIIKSFEEDYEEKVLLFKFDKKATRTKAGTCFILVKTSYDKFLIYSCVYHQDDSVKLGYVDTYIDDEINLDRFIKYADFLKDVNPSTLKTLYGKSKKEKTK